MPDDRSNYSITFENDGRVAVRLDCKRGSGTWKSAGPNQLQFGSLALTRASVGRVPCTTGWRKTGEGRAPFLSMMADGGIYEFEPIILLTQGHPKRHLKYPRMSRGISLGQISVE